MDRKRCLVDHRNDMNSPGWGGAETNVRKAVAEFRRALQVSVDQDVAASTANPGTIASTTGLEVQHRAND